METPETDGKVTQIIKIYLLMFRNHTTCLNTYQLKTVFYNVYIEYCKKLKPSIYSGEIQNKLVEDSVCLPENVPSRSSLSRSLKHELGYSYKKISVIP